MKVAAVVALCALLCLATVSAQDTNALKNITMTSADGSQWKMDINSFTTSGGLTAVGTCTGTDGAGNPIPQTPCTSPVTRINGEAPPTGGRKLMQDTAAGCGILNLVLGPLSLNLLGLLVQIPAPVTVIITAVPGAGALLGNLLCAVTNLLNGPGTSLIGLTNLLNTIAATLAGLGL